VLQGFALWNLGFRPFYLLAGTFAVITIACWVAQFAGVLGSHTYLAGPAWHAHEMIFGYAFAVITGFLFTAVRNWTGEPTPSGATLAAIAGLWLAGRILVVAPWPALAAIADSAFAIAAATAIAVPLLKSRNRRNYFFIGLLLALGALNLTFHLAMAHETALPVGRALQVGLDVILFVIAVMGGRVIPMFTANGVPGSQPRRLLWIERTALASVLALTACDLFGLPSTAVALVAAAAGIAHAARLWLWQPWRTARHPIVWILHVSYAWIPVHLALRVLGAFDFMPDSLASHAFTVGAVGGLTIGMMTRTARGHTGRPLQASAAEATAYALVQFAATVRVFLPLIAPGLYLAAVVLSGALWVAAFALFTVMFWPILSRQRFDGRNG
jgi:uncharacterized protein involved in response to NO